MVYRTCTGMKAMVEMFVYITIMKSYLEMKRQ